MEERIEKIVEDIVIRFSGDSGDGMQMTGTLFTETAAYLGNGVSTFPDYPSEIRAPQGTVSGVSGFQVHVGSKKVTTPGDDCDILVAMNPAALFANHVWLKKIATIVVNADAFTEKNIEKAGFKTNDPFEELKLKGYNIVYAPISSMTKEACADLDLDVKSVNKCRNMFALGLCFFMCDRPLHFTEKYINTKFGKKPLVAEANILVLNAGFNYGANTHTLSNIYKISSAEHLQKGRYRSINGNEAAAWGLIAASEKSGRPLFCGSYPITPATAILEALAKRRDLGVKTLQAEDEIAGICTSIGASYAGNLAATTTSGPGLSLKSEALGLAVMTELPLVVIDVQRGGPSTGLPTKVEQSDLNQALWGRNGECPMPVFAASTPSDCFHKSFMAAKIAMEHMTPVMLLTDCFVANGSEPWLIPSMKDYPTITPPVEEAREEGSEPFHPYTRDELRHARKWAFPGVKGLQHRIGGLEKKHGVGSLCHEATNHELMTYNRQEKVDRVANFLPEQEVYGSESGKVLIVGWGGTYGHLLSATQEMRAEGKDVSLCHVSYINPLPKNIKDIFAKYEKIVVCELNLGQFVGYLRMTNPEFVYSQYNKVQGQPFTVTELKENIAKLLEA